MSGQENDPFEKVPEVSSEWPKRIAPEAETLALFGEPILEGKAQKGHCDIRFIWVPTFNKPFSIRLTKNKDEIDLRVVRMEGKGGYEWGEVELEKNLKLKEFQFESLVSLVSIDGAREPSQKGTAEYRENFIAFLSGLDGSIWYLEVRDEDGYTVEGVPNPLIPDPEERKKFEEASKLNFKPFLDVCMQLFTLSELDQKPKY